MSHQHGRHPAARDQKTGQIMELRSVTKQWIQREVEDGVDQIGNEEAEHQNELVEQDDQRSQHTWLPEKITERRPRLANAQAARRRGWQSAQMVLRFYQMPFGVFLGSMAVFAFFFGNPLLRWYGRLW